MKGNGIIEIRDYRPKPGQSVRGFLDIGETSLGPIQVPIVIIRGTEQGPTLCITGGVHATEYAPIDAALRILTEVKPSALKGTLIVCPVVNMHMFVSRTGFVSPLDGLNLNKIAPGTDQGSISEILADVLIKEVIGKADYHIDLHAGDLGEILWPFAACMATGVVELDRRAETLARLYTPELISIGRGDGKLPPFAGFLVLAAAQSGVASILAEAGGNGTLESADVETHLNGIRNAMRYFGMIEGKPAIPGKQSVAVERVLHRAKRAGLVRTRVSIGDRVSVGQELATVCNVFGDVIETINSKTAGTVGLVWGHKVVSTGDPVVRCWVTEAAPPFPETDRFIRPS